MTTEQRITTFNEENRPFYIVDLESGRYSLCLPLDLLGDEFYPYCQSAFDAYAREIASFSNSLLTGAPVEVPAQQAVQVQRIMEAAYRSNDEKITITL